MDDLLISVIVPVYNPGSHLRKCLESLVNQSYRNLQIILIDDGSTDGSSKICDEYAAKDERIVCIHQQNKGVSKARNVGIALSSGDYLHFPDSDDYIEFNTYEYLIDLIKKHNCEVVSFEYFINYPDKEVRHHSDSSQYGLFEKKEAQRLSLTGIPFACNKIFEKKLITGDTSLSRIKFREDIYRGEDSLFIRQVINRAELTYFDKKTLYHYVQSEESAVRGRFRQSQLSALKLYDAYQPLYMGEYQELYPIFLKNMAHLIISLYYDMWIDEEDYKSEQTRAHKTFKKYESTLFQSGILKRSELIKFKLFSISPILFCGIHMILHL